MKALVNTQPVAKSVPFDNNTTSYNSTEIQSALEEARRRIVWDVTQTATSNAGALTLAETSDSLQIFSGSGIGYSVVLPNATTLFEGRKFEFVNQTSSPIIVKTNGGATLFTLAQTSIAYITLQDNATSVGAWIQYQTFIAIAGGVVTYNLTSSTAFATSSTTDIQITSFTLTPQAGTYAVWYNASVLHTTTPRNHWWSIYKEGSKVADSERQQRTSSSNQVLNDSTMSIIYFNGSQSADIRVRVENGSLTVNNRSLLLIRLGN